MWMNYDTSITAQSFIVQVAISALANFLLMATLYTLSFIAAESLTRKAFPNRIQFWKLWSPEVGNSLSVLGRTVGGYLTAGLFLFYSLVFYMFTHDTLGWWSPADTDYDPVVHFSTIDELNEKLSQALAKSLEWDNKIPTGIFYKNELITPYTKRITDKIPNYLENPAAKQRISKNGAPSTDISKLLDSLRI